MCARRFKQKKYDEAIIRYDSALRHCEYVPTDIAPPPAEAATSSASTAPAGAASDPAAVARWKARRLALETLCYSNLSACFHQQRKWDQVIDFARKALERDPALPKAHYRISQVPPHACA